ncbi:hypothetical protein B1759_15700 [Rubrivirga sp. SAORIC476]|uniref:hypothetical protein n=1 Tax=Rubrivirga sp. SAORIC476 TaxID=1961794 RepID=UPI000BA917EA|nr:hypothetical protein [Rubrivirga sp. SAORIC476]PAP78885.1 hypothetical protein B1759_15700 [Rubrivirga sp. SAORIC476]
MISTDDEYQRALRRLNEDAATLRRQRAALAESRLSGDELDRAMAPLLSFRAGLEEEVEAYEDGRLSGSEG